MVSSFVYHCVLSVWGEYPLRKNSNIDICFGAGDSISLPKITIRKINMNLSPTCPQPPSQGTTVTALQ